MYIDSFHDSEGRVHLILLCNIRDESIYDEEELLVSIKHESRVQLQ